MNSNANSRALVSALRSDLVLLRKAAIVIIDDAAEGASKWERVNVQLVLGTSRNTARALLRERAKFDKGGRRR